MSVNPESAAAVAALMNASAAVAAQHTAEANNKFTRKCRADADRDLPSFVNAIKLNARLGHTDAFFAVIEEDEELYWTFIVNDLRALGYEVNIAGLEQRRRFRARGLQSSDAFYAKQSLRYIEGGLRDGSSTRISCVGQVHRDSPHTYYEATNKDLLSDRLVSIWDTSCWCLFIFELLWFLTLIGPFICGCCRVCGCCAIVSDSARTRVTCNAPYKTSSCTGDWVVPGAIWFVRVSWSSAARAAAATASPTSDALIPVAVPIDVK